MKREEPNMNGDLAFLTEMDLTVYWVTVADGWRPHTRSCGRFVQVTSGEIERGHL